MHEFSLIASLLRQVVTLAQTAGAQRILGVTVRLGALSHLSADHFHEHFRQAALGTPAEGAQLDVVECTDLTAPHAQEVVLESLEIATD